MSPKDTNGDGHISLEEYEMDMEFKRKELEDADAMRDAHQDGVVLISKIFIISIRSCTRNGIRIRPSSKILGK